MTTTEGAAFSNTAAKESLNCRRADGAIAACGTTGSAAGAVTTARQSNGMSHVFFMPEKNTSTQNDFKWRAAFFYKKKRTGITSPPLFLKLVGFLLVL
jgi:cysteine synthase